MASIRNRMLVRGGMCVLLALPCFGFKVGDIVSGEIVSEDNQVLALRKNPCDPDSTTVAFSYPWKKRKLASKTCPDKSVHDVYEVEQLPDPCDKAKDGDKAKEGCPAEANPKPDGDSRKNAKPPEKKSS
jgi:hypothetical protein